ncbi:MAG: type II methionyl aminopeptidase [Candidatus Helarchaeota archaeon]|nr:type II methionyl aminopeptidase [Candidatus Helarchaeota archaeon]
MSEEPQETKKTQETEEGSEDEEEDEHKKYEHYKKAGEIHYEARKLAEPLIKIGAKIVDICDTIENFILEKGGGLAFPVNVSRNEIAAHYTASSATDPTVIQEGDIVKIDIGVHVEGYIADGAFSVAFNEDFEKLVEASKAALEAVIGVIRPNRETHKLGAIAEAAIKSHGYRPVRDLSGHILEQWELHGKKTIPSITLPAGEKIEEGEVYAIEYFATTGTGSVHDLPPTYIYNLVPIKRPMRSKGARQIVREVSNKYKTLPFARRWLLRDLKGGVLLGLRELTRIGLLHEYHPLAEKKGIFISQAEDTVIIEHDGCTVTTRKDI